MATTQRNLSIHDTVRTEPPVAVRAATAAWFLAVGAGVAESILGVIGALGDRSIPWPALLTQIAFRTIIYGGLFVVIDKFFRLGRNWSRHLLAGLLGVVGMATLIVGPIQWLLADGNFGAIDVTADFAAFAAFRSVHVMAVIAGVVLMYQPDANRWFKARS
ncbi:hypothetical protein [Streptomyces sp. SID13031]|uniref:hypothetical protein n=1 Tax=Streptomyces sp. SID13031 TaxID=2706046 RepID=UPI0013C68FB6|nr:hypothetical protein [Streptomyces sp. SID13031]NEA34605.1 hypothetical protein [Streptomyces sp. SID13031]